MLLYSYVSSVHSVYYASALYSYALTMLCKSLFYIAILAVCAKSLFLLDILVVLRVWRGNLLKSLGFLV